MILATSSYWAQVVLKMERNKSTAYIFNNAGEEDQISMTIYIQNIYLNIFTVTHTCFEIILPQTINCKLHLRNSR